MKVPAPRGREKPEAPADPESTPGYVYLDTERVREEPPLNLTVADELRVRGSAGGVIVGSMAAPRSSRELHLAITYAHVHIC